MAREQLKQVSQLSELRITEERQRANTAVFRPSSDLQNSTSRVQRETRQIIKFPKAERSSSGRES